LGGEGEFARLLNVEDGVMLELAQAPCASDAEFFEKAAHILACHVADLGEPKIDHDFGALAIARSRRISGSGPEGGLALKVSKFAALTWRAWARPFCDLAVFLFHSLGAKTPKNARHHAIRALTDQTGCLAHVLRSGRSL
jgi:hypothetical protein